MVAAAAWPAASRAFTNVAIGDLVDDAELRTVDGARHPLLQKGAAVNVLVFFRPEQGHSMDALRDVAACERDFAGKPVHWVGIVSDSWTTADVKAFVAETGIRMPVLWDAGDALYGKLGVRLHPAIGIVDAKRRLAGYEPFRQINYCDRVRARIRIVLGELPESAFASVEAPERSITRTDDGVARRHVNFARSLFRIGKHDKALAEVQKSLAVAPSATAWVLQGQILAAGGSCPDALRAWESALKLDPANPEALAGRKSCGR
jgi:peroxiredoxin